jgi:uncharacterized membrane protein YedE/YeeE
MKEESAMYFARCPWYVAGPLIGLIIVGLRLTLNRPFGAAGGLVELVERFGNRRALGAPAFIALGTVLGGALFAVLSGTFGFTWQYGAGAALLPASNVSQFAMLTLAGLVMGYGARMAGGCTSGHGLCGMSLGSRASVLATMTFFGTAVLLSSLFAFLAAQQQ